MPLECSATRSDQKRKVIKGPLGVDEDTVRLVEHREDVVSASTCQDNGGLNRAQVEPATISTVARTARSVDPVVLGIPVSV